MAHPRQSPPAAAAGGRTVPQNRRERAMLRAYELYQNGRAAEAHAQFAGLLAKMPKNAQLHYLAGLAALDIRETASAARHFAQAASLEPGSDLYAFHLGVALDWLGRREEAASAYRRAGEINPKNADAHYNLGTALQAIGRLDEAVAAYRRAVECAPEDAEALNNLGVALKNLGKLEEARATIERALTFDEGNIGALANLGAVLTALGRAEEAVAVVERAIRLQPDAAAAHNNLGQALLARRDPEAAEAAFARALALAPALVPAINNRANARLAMGDRTGAEALYREAIARDAGFADAHANLGNLLRVQERTAEALEHNRRAVELAPDRAQMFEGLGQTLAVQGDHEAAVAALERAVALDPNYLEAEARLLASRQQACLWDGFDERRRALIDRARARIARGEDCGIEPHFALVLADDPVFQAEIAAARALRVARDTEWLAHRVRFEHKRETPAKLRIGYVSPAFGDKPTAHLVAGMIEAHDRDRFEVVGYALGPDDGSDYARRVRAACGGGFVELRDTPTAEAARRIHADGIHILADLRGYAQGYRPEVLALRPAPICVTLVGYPGTMSAPFVDYFVADAIVAPSSAAPHFAEALVTMPGCYLPTDDRQAVAPPVARAECGLPEGVVLACFNTNYKIEPTIFAAWMEILAAAPNAVLWLISSNPAAESNLRREAAARGVDAKRLVFAPRWAKPRHLARHAHADLFLDTHFVNAHTTAVDALTSGVPVLTWPGESFVARVGASLVSAAGLEELIAFDRDSYVAMASALARDPAALRALKERLAGNRATAPLFDTRRYTRNLEHAYQEMWRRHAAGLEPQPIVVPDAA